MGRFFALTFAQRKFCAPSTRFPWSSKFLMSFASSPGYQAALHIVRSLRDRGFDAYFAGGCVRDLLLGIEPKDYDVATSATPEKVLMGFARTFSVGMHFGVVIVCTANKDAGCEVQTEVATFRSDGDYTDGRRPDEISYADTAQEDVIRRDFTINGMLLDPIGLTAENIPERVLDFVGGREDLRAGIVRAIGEPERRFREDKLRMLRAVRFAARFGFQIESATMHAMQQQASTIGQVSNERVRDELTKMLTEGHARRAFELMDEGGLLRYVLPEVAAMKGVEQPPEWHPEGDVWIHTLMLLEKLEAGAKPTLAWSALLHDVGKPPTFRAPDPADPKPRIRFNGHADVGATMTRAILNRLRFSTSDTDQIVSLVANHMRFGDVKNMKQSTLKRFFRLQDFPEHLALHKLDVTSSHNLLGMYDYAKQNFEAAPVDEWKPALLLTGRDLIDSGLKPGPRFKQLLSEIEDAQLEGSIRTRDEAINLLRELLKKQQVDGVTSQQISEVSVS
jgi:poly(A) polymerase